MLEVTGSAFNFVGL